MLTRVAFYLILHSDLHTLSNFPVNFFHSLLSFPTFAFQCSEKIIYVTSFFGSSTGVVSTVHFPSPVISVVCCLQYCFKIQFHPLDWRIHPSHQICFSYRCFSPHKMTLLAYSCHQTCVLGWRYYRNAFVAGAEAQTLLGELAVLHRPSRWIWGLLWGGRGRKREDERMEGKVGEWEEE